MGRNVERHTEHSKRLFQAIHRNMQPAALEEFETRLAILSKAVEITHVADCREEWGKSKQKIASNAFEIAYLIAIHCQISKERKDQIVRLLNDLKSDF